MFYTQCYLVLTEAQYSGFFIAMLQMIKLRLLEMKWLAPSQTACTVYILYWDTANLKGCVTQNYHQHPSSLGWLPRWFSGKDSTCQCRRHGFDAWVRKTPWRREWQYLFQYSCLGNPINRGAWWTTVSCSCTELDSTERLSMHEPFITLKSSLFYF